MAEPMNPLERYCHHLSAFEAMYTDYEEMKKLITRSPLMLEDANISLRNLTRQLVSLTLAPLLVCRFLF